MKATFPSTILWVLSLVVAVLGTPTRGSAAVSYTVTESWSATLEYRNFAGGITTTRQFSGQQSGTIQVNGGRFEIIDRSGVRWSAPGENLDLKTRSLSVSGLNHRIDGDYVFAPAFGAQAFGLVFLGCFVVKVSMIDGEVPAFFNFDTFSASGPATAIQGGGNMIGNSLRVYVSSTLSLREVVGPPAISQQPQSLVLSEGQIATFRVTAGGREPLGYVWRKGSAAVAGANSSVLTITNVQLSDAGSYSVIVSNAGGQVTSASAKLTVKPPGPPWFEGWETAALSAHFPKTNGQTTTVPGDKGQWVVTDTVSSFPLCGPPRSHVDIVQENGRKLLKLIAVDSGSSCADNVEVSIDGQTSASLPIPLSPDVRISFFEQGAIVNPQWNGSVDCVGPPCGDTIHLAVLDNLGNRVVYIFQRPTNYAEHTGVRYRQILLDAAGGLFDRNLYSDFASIAGAGEVGTTIEGISFGVAKEGWAMLDDLFIGSSSTNSDLVSPRLTITTPAPGMRVFDSSGTLEGTASDNVAVAAVEYRLENARGVGSYQPALGTLRWAAIVSDLEPGTNTVRVRARDVVGRYSTESTRQIVFVVLVPLTLDIGPPGGGTVTGATNGQRLEVGKSYTISAVAAPGLVFSNWTGGITARTPTLRFTMQSNLALTANFVPNPFTAGAGSYQGLFHEQDELQHGSSGLFSMTLKNNGTFSASLMNGRTKFPFSGAFDLEGKATNQVARRGQSSLAVQLALDLPGANRMTGSVSDGTWTAPLLADRAGFSRTDPTTEFARTFTVLIPGGTNANHEPSGDGFGTVSVKSDGMLTFTGTMADGTSAGTQRVPLSRRGEWPLYLSLYGGKGSLVGWLGLSPANDTNVAGRLNWFRPAGSPPNIYTNGFVLESMAVGSVYTPFGTNRLFDSERARVIFTGGGLAVALTNEVALGLSGRVVDLGSNGLGFKAVSAAGSFRGTVTPPGYTRPISFQGTLLPRLGMGGGFYLNAGQSGRVEIRPADAE